MIAVDLSRKKELDVGRKEIQQIKFLGQLKNENCINADGTQSMFISTIFEIGNKETRLNFSQRSVTVL